MPCPVCPTESRRFAWAVGIEGPGHHGNEEEDGTYGPWSLYVAMVCNGQRVPA